MQLWRLELTTVTTFWIQLLIQKQYRSQQERQGCHRFQLHKQSTSFNEFNQRETSSMTELLRLHNQMWLKNCFSGLFGTRVRELHWANPNYIQPVASGFIHWFLILICKCYHIPVTNSQDVLPSRPFLGLNILFLLYVH